MPAAAQIAFAQGPVLSAFVGPPAGQIISVGTPLLAMIVWTLLANVGEYAATSDPPPVPTVIARWLHGIDQLLLIPADDRPEQRYPH